MFAMEKYGYTPSIDEVLDTLMTGPAGAGWRWQTFSPATDVLEAPEGYILELDLPGLTEKDVAVTLESNRLTIAGERKAPQTEGYTRIERTSGRFERTFNLPDDVDTTHIEAKAKNGVLTVRLPKAEKAKPKTIEIVAG